MTKVSKIKPVKLPSDAELVTIAQATQRLGQGYSRRSIFRRIRSGECQEGVHWIDDRPRDSAKAIIKINITAVNEL